ncbi:hypothetical protein NEIPOLOT_02051 [Neisseria polysaccharea ATCC 43768]|nr:hypothetical protein NEIPOLOT_02051 [Neisseria polysaccharea ATCC 43768]
MQECFKIAAVSNFWIPACAGMTAGGNRGSDSGIRLYGIAEQTVGYKYPDN